MVNWKIVNQFAVVFGIIFAVFTVLAGVFNYELSKVLYAEGAPAGIFIYTALIAILPFLLIAVLSFAVAYLGSHAIKSAVEKEEETEEQEKEIQKTEEQETEA